MNYIIGMARDFSNLRCVNLFRFFKNLLQALTEGGLTKGCRTKKNGVPLLTYIVHWHMCIPLLYIYISLFHP